MKLQEGNVFSRVWHSVQAGERSHVTMTHNAFDHTMQEPLTPNMESHRTGTPSPGPIPGHVQTCSTSTSLSTGTPTGHIQTFSLYNMYNCQVGSLYPTGMVSCLSFIVPLHFRQYYCWIKNKDSWGLLVKMLSICFDAIVFNKTFFFTDKSPLVVTSQHNSVYL